MRRARSSRPRALLAAGLLVLIVLGLNYGLHRLHLSRFSSPRFWEGRPPPELAHETVLPEVQRRVGWLLTDKTSSFVNFPRHKPPGVVRVGCFGDSFTYGDETGPQGDFPTQLQALLRESGYRNVEVLNFGTSWWGFHQAYMLWEGVGREYGLDYIVLGPQGFYVDRDATFNHSLPETPYMLHARYVLDRKGLALVEPVGKDAYERAALYLGFLPRWRYVRYDYWAPAFLNAWAPWVPRLRNPFYYRFASWEQEVRQTHRLLIERMARSGAQVLRIHYGNANSGLAKGHPGVYETELLQPRRFPYMAPMNHNSAQGNRLVARQLFCLLTGRAACGLELASFGPAQAPSLPPPFPRLAAYDSVAVSYPGGGRGAFYTVSGGKSARVSRVESRGGLVELGAADGGGPAFLALRADARAGAPVALRLRRGGRLELGSLSRLAPGLDLWRADLSRLLGSSPHARLGFALDCRPDADLARALKEGGGGELLIGEERVAALFSHDGGWRLRPVGGRRYFGLHLDKTAAPPAAIAQGTLELVLRREGKDHRVPMRSLVPRAETVRFEGLERVRPLPRPRAR